MHILSTICLYEVIFAYIYAWKSSGGGGPLTFALVASKMLIFIYLLAWKSSRVGGPVWWERHDLPPFQIKAVPLIKILITNLLMMIIVALLFTIKR